MSLSKILSKIQDQNIKKKLINIASKDGGKNKKEIDERKGYYELCDLLSGAKDNDKDLLLGLKLECEKNLNITENNTNSKNNIGNNNSGVIIGSDHCAAGGDNSVNISGNNNNVTVNQYISNDDRNKVEIAAKDKRKGATLAREVYNETVSSLIASNDTIVSKIAEVDKKTAYSFFDAYKTLKGGKPEIIQDVYGVSDMFNRITSQQAYHLINVLLQQAVDLGLQNTDAYKDLKTQAQSIKNKQNKDPTSSQEINFDYAIKNLMDEMSKKIK